MSHSFPNPEETLEVDVSFLHGLMESGEGGFVLIDCREEDEHTFCHLPGDRLIPLSRFVPAIEGALPEPGIPVIVYCHHGMRSGQAAHYLRSKGRLLTFSLRGGIDVWSTEIDPSVPRY